MQEGEDPRYLKTSACCKHFLAYDLEDWNSTDRHHFDAVVTEADLANYYLPAFQACVQDANVSSLMCSVSFSPPRTSQAHTTRAHGTH